MLYCSFQYHKQILLGITKLKIMLNYWGFAIRNIFVISEHFWKKIVNRLASTIAVVSINQFADIFAF